MFGPEFSETVMAAVKAFAELKTSYQDDWEPPTDHAYWQAFNLVVGAYFQVASQHPGCALPIPFVSTDDSGGVRIAWRFQTKQVRVNVGGRPGLRSYIYFQSSSGHDIDAPLATTLADRLYWLIAG